MPITDLFASLKTPCQLKVASGVGVDTPTPDGKKLYGNNIRFALPDGAELAGRLDGVWTLQEIAAPQENVLSAFAITESGESGRSLFVTPAGLVFEIKPPDA